MNNQISIFCKSAWQKIKILMISNVEDAIKKQAFSSNEEEVCILKVFVCKGEAIWQVITILNVSTLSVISLLPTLS